MRYFPLARGFFIASPFGPRTGGFHAGTDFGWPGGSAGQPVYACQSGTVLYAGAASGYGGPDPAGWLVIDHPTADGGGCTEYGHLVREVSLGQRVEAGQRIGHINPDSNTNGGVPPHCHLSVMPAGYDPNTKIDPIPWLGDAAYAGETPAPAGATVTEFNDGNQYHYITDPAAYERACLMYEYRVLSGSTGQMLTDTRFAQQRAAMQPLLDGMLYYAKPDSQSTPEQQATLFCDLLGRLAPNEMVMLDTEPSCNLADYADFMHRWCAVVEPRLNTLAWIYVPQALSGVLTRAVTGNRIVKAPKYSGTDQRGPAPSWPYDVHQYSDKGAFPGGNGPGDVNFTDLTVPQMLDRCRTVSVQPQGVPMLMPPRRAMWSPNCDDRPRNVTWLCFHTQEGNGTADSLARYLDNPASGVSYNTVGDGGELIDVVPFDRSPWAALGANGRADHFCFGGSFSAWSRQQWLDCGMLDNAAAWLADRATVRGLPITYVGTDGVRNNQPGVIGHVDWTRGAGEGTHTDPGPNFPWDELITRAQRLTTTTQGVDVTPDECRQAIRDVLNEQAPTRVPGSTVALGLGDCIRNADAASFIAQHAVTDPITSGVAGSTVQMSPQDVWRNAEANSYLVAVQQGPALLAAVQALADKYTAVGPAPVPATDVSAALRAVLATLTLTAKVA